MAVSPLDFVIRWAYDLDVRQFREFSQKLPDWAGSPSGAYALEAKADTAVSETQCRKMVQNLLMDRFKFFCSLGDASRRRVQSSRLQRRP